MSCPSECVVINLPERTDRRADMEVQLRRVGWDAKFFPAIRPHERGEFPTVGSKGCFLSHLAVLKAARDQQARRLIILEDDLNFANDFVARWTRYMNQLENSPWSILYPGHLLNTAPSGLNLLDPSTPVQTTHFMVIHANAIPRIVEGFETILSRPAGHPLGGPMHVDGAYSTIRAQNVDLRTYCISPALGYQRPSRTDIADLKWFDRITAVRPFVNAARRAKSVIFR
jgi:glycosyl transferase family 25